jgi:hypothetical protein
MKMGLLKNLSRAEFDKFSKQKCLNFIYYNITKKSFAFTLNNKHYTVDLIFIYCMYSK